MLLYYYWNILFSIISFIEKNYINIFKLSNYVKDYIFFNKKFKFHQPNFVCGILLEGFSDD